MERGRYIDSTHPPTWQQLPWTLVKCVCPQLIEVKRVIKTLYRSHSVDLLLRCFHLKSLPNWVLEQPSVLQHRPDTAHKHLHLFVCLPAPSGIDWSPPPPLHPAVFHWSHHHEITFQPVLHSAFQMRPVDRCSFSGRRLSVFVLRTKGVGFHWLMHKR